jgi:hypothetical protein
MQYPNCSPFLHSNIPLSTLVSNILNSSTFPKITDHIKHL